MLYTYICIERERDSCSCSCRSSLVGCCCFLFRDLVDWPVPQGMRIAAGFGRGRHPMYYVLILVLCPILMYHVLSYDYFYYDYDYDYDDDYDY